MIFSNYTAQDWYWIVAGDDTKVYASQRVGYFPVADATYAAWLDAGNLPTRIINSQELLDVLMQQWVPSYLATGMQVVSTGTPSLNDTYPMDQTSQNQITGIATSIAAGRGLPGGGSTFFYQGHQFNEASFLNFADAASNFVYGSYHSLGLIVMTGSGSMPAQPVTIP